MKKYLTNNSLETENLGTAFAKTLKSRDAVLLYGALGAGKTTFIQGVGKGLGIKDRILSPTFVLIRSHAVNIRNIKSLNHVDLYRIEGQAGIKSLGLEEVVDEDGGVTLIEWADRISNFKSKKGYKIVFEYLDENKREIRIEKLT